MTQLGYVGFSVSDLDAWKKYATEVLGLQITDDSDKENVYLRMDINHHRVIIHPDGNDDLAYAGWEVPDAHALEAMAARLEEAGVKVTPGTREDAEARRVLDLVRFEDPSGIPMEIYYGPLFERQPFYPSRPISGFRTGNLGTGHIVVHARDLEESTRFYRDVLGMRISDYVHIATPRGKMDMVFFHCNPRHHSLAFVEAPRAPKRLQHLMIESNSLDDVGTGFDLCHQRGIETTGLGKHTNDLMISFYMVTPSAFRIELGWNGREVDDSTWQVRHYESGSIWGHEGLGRMGAASAASAGQPGAGH